MLGAAAQTDDKPSHFARWHAYMIHQTFTPETKRYEGRIVGDIAREEGKEPFDALADIAVADGLRTMFGTPSRVDTRADWEARMEVLHEGRAIIGGSDAGAHLDMIDTFRFATNLLEQGVREHGVLTTEEAVHQITQVPAQLYGLRDRGVLREGAYADLVVFDEDTVGSGPVYSRADLPGGAARLYADSIGVDHVIVNGEPIVDHGELTGSRPGGVLRSGRDTTATAVR
jgi:N-acyl-D-aspartate/D-glutamate deacylase